MSDLRRKKLLKRKKKIKERGEGSSMIFLKADSELRVRPLRVDENEEFGLEITQYYLGAEIKVVISPATFGEPCAIMEMYGELNSGDDDDRELAKKLRPKVKYVIPILVYEDSKGKKVDQGRSEKLLLVTQGVYDTLIDLFLDEEQGDFTDPKTGYDIKVKRVGSGMTDTEYSVIPCRPSKIPKKYNKVYDIEEMLRKEVPSYEETEEILNKYLNVDEDDKPKKKKKKKKGVKKSKSGLKKKKSSKKK